MQPSPRRHARIDAICRALVSRLAATLNRRDTGALASLLAPEVAWDMPDGQRLHCPAQVSRGYGELWSRPGIDDVWLDLDTARTTSIEVESDSRARASTWVVLYRAVAQPDRSVICPSQAELIGCCRHVFARTRNGWRITAHRSTRIWLAASAARLPVQRAATSLLT